MSESQQNSTLAALLKEAAAAYAEGGLTKAEQLLRGVLLQFPSSVQALQLSGKVLQGLGRLDAAIAAYRHALALGGSSVSLHNNLGSALQVQGKLEESEKAFLQALALTPDDPRIRYNLGLNFELRGRMPEAAGQYRKALEPRPGYVRALVGLGRVHQEQGQAQEAVNAYQAAIKIEPRTREAHLQLGHILAGEQKYDLATVCFNNALHIDADEVDAHLGLGEIHKDQGRLAEAERCYRKACELGSVMAGHFLAAVRHEKTAAAPREYVTELFDAYAKDFEGHLVGELSYQTPKLLCEALRTATRARKPFPRAVDLGCGTGLAGVEFRSLVRRIEGVDLSSEMLQEAEKKGIYSGLYAADIAEHLRGSAIGYDLFIAADVLVYVGDLDEILTVVRGSAQPGAYFVFNVERLDEGDYLLQLNGRYAHAEPYVRASAQKAGFNTALCRPVPLRKENDQWVPGLIFVLKATA